MFAVMGAFGLSLLAGCDESPELRGGGPNGPNNPDNPDGRLTIDGSEPTDGADANTFPSVAPFEWVGVISTGQSLSVGYAAGPAVSTTQPFNNKKLVDNGPVPQYPIDGNGAIYELAPLTEPFRVRSLPGYAGSEEQYPNNIWGETPNAGMANEISSLWLARTGKEYVTIHSNVGWSGHALSFIDKRGGTGKAYPASLTEARTLTAMAKAAGKTFGYGAVILTHGESDSTNPDYGTGLVNLINDYNEDLKTITGQTRDVVLLVSQQSTLADGVNGGSARLVWEAANANPTRIVCTGPKYQYDYADDRLHFPAASYRALGEKYAEVFDEIVNKGRAWKPVQPKTVARSGKTITIDFDVPSPPLAWDETLAPPHQGAHTGWSQGRGFEVRNGGTELAIASVELSGPTQVKITLAADPGSASLGLGYAITQDGTGFWGGEPSGLRGQLFDSDELVGYDEETIEVTATNGSATITKAGAFANRGLRDVVTASGLPKNVRIAAKPSNDSITLSTPWPGATGPATIKIHHDLHNYGVQFFLAVP